MTLNTSFTIHQLHPSETHLLQDFLYEAIFIPEGVTPPPREIVEQPELRVYTDDFGTRRGDNCFVAEVGGRVVGAVWTRIMNDYGHVDDEPPSFAISLYREYRGQGIGTQNDAKDAGTFEGTGLREGVSGGTEGKLCGEDVP